MTADSTSTSHPAISAQSLGASASAILVLCCAIWGLNQIAMKIAVIGISPIFLAGLRSIGAGVLVAAWMAWRGLPLWPRDGTWPAGVFVGLLFAAEFIFLYAGMELTAASRGVVLLHIAPFSVAIGSHFFVPGESLTRAKVFGLAAAFAGIVLAFSDKLAAPERSQILGDLFCLIGGIFWGATTVAIKATSLRRAPAENTLFYQLAVSALVLPLAALLMGEPGVVAPTAKVWAALAFQIAVVAFASYLVWFWLMRRHAGSVLAAFTFLTPVFGVFFGWLLLGEPIGVTLLGAVALIAAGIYIVNRG